MTDLDVLAEGARTLGVNLDEHQFAQFQTYLDGMGAWNQRINLTSASALADAERVHLLDSLTLVPIIRLWNPAATRMVDIGSGAGLPGLAIKIAMPWLQVVLVEANRKKAEFLSWVVSTLKLDTVEVIHDRAEMVGHHTNFRESFDIATARAVGTLSAVMELTLPLCKSGGTLLAQRGADAEREALEAEGATRKLGGLATVEWIETPGRGMSGVVVVRKAGKTPDQYPRRVGIPTKRPLT